MVGGKFAEQFRHARRIPAVAATPEKRRVGGVEEEAIGLLQLVEVGGHRERGAIQINFISRGAISLHLHGGDHVHVVHLITGFARDAVGGGVFPLLIREGLAKGEILGVLGQ